MRARSNRKRRWLGKVCAERLTQASSMVFGTGAFVVVKRAPAAQRRL
jgi:hypothetical protein